MNYCQYCFVDLEDEKDQEVGFCPECRECREKKGRSLLELSLTYLGRARAMERIPTESAQAKARNYRGLAQAFLDEYEKEGKK